MRWGCRHCRFMRARVRVCVLDRCCVWCFCVSLDVWWQGTLCASSKAPPHVCALKTGFRFSLLKKCVFFALGACARGVCWSGRAAGQSERVSDGVRG